MNKTPKELTEITDCLKSISDNTNELCESLTKTSLTINKRLDKIEKRLVTLEASGLKMDNHINFIESVYEKIKLPFHYVMDKVNTFKKLDSVTRNTITNSDIQNN